MAWCDCMRRRLRRILDSTGPVVPTYHAVSPPTKIPFLSGQFHRIEPDVFVRQIEWLQSRFDIISTEEMLTRALSGKQLSGTAAVTFDDGYQSVIEHAVPILTSMKVPATIYITTSLLTPPGMLWRDLVRWILFYEKVDAFLAFARNHDSVFNSVRSDHFYRDTKDPNRIDSPRAARMLEAYFVQEGIDFRKSARTLYCDIENLKRLPSDLIHVGNHGCRHYLFSCLDPMKQKEEIEEGDRVLRDAGLSVSGFFSLPNGGQNDYNDNTLSVIKSTGYGGILLCNQPVENAGKIPLQWLGGLACIHRFLAPLETFESSTC